MFRRHERAGLDTYINKIIGDEPHLVRISDISAGGVFLYPLLEPQKTNPVNEVGLEIQLPDCKDVIWAVAEVVRCDTQSGEGQALRFKRIADSDRETIRRYVRSARNPESNELRIAV